MNEPRIRLRSARSRNLRYLTLVALVLLLSAAWIGFWKYAADAAQGAIEGWRAREAKAGRIHTCGTQEVGGFPFRFELICMRAGALIRTAQPPVELKAASVHIAAQVYQPSLLVSEIAGPLTIGEPGRAPDYIANWKLAQTSVRGTPSAPERLSLVFDAPVVTRAPPVEPLFRAQHVEIHGRVAEGSVSNRPVLEIAFQANKMQAPVINAAMAQTTTDADIDFVLRGLNDFSPKPWPTLFREIQQASGRIEIRNARVQYGDTIAVGSGSLTINPRGRLDGQLNMTVAGLEAFINQVTAANQQRLGFGVQLGLGLLGGNKQLEGRPAIAVPLRIDDGVMRLGPLRIAEVPPLF
jgi:hypothetical protein